MSKTDFLPTLPLRDIVVFPGMIVPLFVGRDKSIKALNEVMKTDKKIILVTQKNAEIDDPLEKDLYTFGCESKILQLLKLPDGTVKALVEGFDRVKIIECKDDKEFLTTSTEVIKDYELTPSEISGSTVQINENSPFLDGEFKGDGWKKIIRGSVEEAISMIKNKDKDDS